MVVRRILRLALLAACLIGAGAAPVRAQDAAGDGPYPVWFAPGLGIQSLAEIPARLAEPFPETERIQFERRRGNDLSVGPKFVWVGNCDEFMALDENRKYRANANNDLGIRQSETAELHRIRCYVWRALARARPATESFVRGFIMTEDALDFLPAMLDYRCREGGSLLRANREGVPHSQYSFVVYGSLPEYVNRLESDTRFVIATVIDSEAVSERHFSIAGRGDFDGDGEGDLLVLSSLVNLPRPSKGRLRRDQFRGLYLVTRAHSESFLRVAAFMAFDEPCLPRDADLAR